MTDNVALKGGAINAESGNVTLRNSKVATNRAVANGGGIFAGRGSVTLSRSTVSLNHAKGDGGGIYAGSGTTTLLNRSSVRRNVAGLPFESTGGLGGGVRAASVVVTNSTVRGNFAFSQGGGIYAPNGARLTRSTVSGNTAGGSGGGINAATVDLANSTVRGNTAGGDGGGIEAAQGTIVNCTIVDNFTAGGFGGGVRQLGGLDPIHVKNTTVANNFRPPDSSDVFGVFVIEGHNLIGVVDSGSTAFAAQGGQLGTPLVDIGALEL